MKNCVILVAFLLPILLTDTKKDLSEKLTKSLEVARNDGGDEDVQKWSWSAPYGWHHHHHPFGGASSVVAENISWVLCLVAYGVIGLMLMRRLNVAT